MTQNSSTDTSKKTQNAIYQSSRRRENNNQDLIPQNRERTICTPVRTILSLRQDWSTAKKRPETAGNSITTLFDRHVRVPSFLGLHNL